MFMTGVIASMGAMQLATHGIYFQIIQVMQLFSASIGMGTELLVAHYTGAMKLDLANKQLIRSVKIGEVMIILLSLRFCFRKRSFSLPPILPFTLEYPNAAFRETCF